MSTPEQRLLIAKSIVDLEARRDSQGNLEICDLPADDYQIAGLQHRYHPSSTEQLKALIAEGNFPEAEAQALEYVATYTDSAARWVADVACEAYLRDTYFHRGPGGAGKILQMAVGAEVDGAVSDLTRLKVQERASDPLALLKAIRRYREVYERKISKVDVSSPAWEALVDRWDQMLSFAKSLVESAPPPAVTPAPEPVAETTPEPVAETTPEPVAETTPEPVAETTPEPVAETTPEPVVEATPEPVAETTPEPIAETTPEPVAETTPEPVAEITPEPKTEVAKETSPEREKDSAPSFFRRVFGKG